MGERTITLNDEEAKRVLESLACLFSRTADPEEVTALMQIAQRIEGFEINGRPGARRLSDKGHYDANDRQ